MKAIFPILLVTLIYQYECKPNKGEMELAEYNCIKKLNVKNEDIPNMTNFQTENEDTENYRKIFGCMFTEMGVIDAHSSKISSDGFDNYVQILSSFIGEDDNTRKLVSDALQTCRNIEGETAGEIGLKFKNCLRTAGLEYQKKLKSLNTV